MSRNYQKPTRFDTCIGCLAVIVVVCSIIVGLCYFFGHAPGPPVPLPMVKVVAVQQNWAGASTVVEYDDGTRRRLKGVWGKEGDRFRLTDEMEFR